MQIKMADSETSRRSRQPSRRLLESFQEKSRSRSPVHRKKTDEGMAGVSDKSKDVGKGRGRGRGRGRQRSLETEPSTSGVGRGRGGRGRGRGRGHSQRKNTAGGEKKTEESLRMSQLVEERKKGIKVAVDRLSEVEAKRLLGEAVYRDPSMMTKVLELTSPEELPPSPSSQPGPQPQWCICTFCREMPTNEEKRCCGKRPVNCLSQSREFASMVIDPMVLHIFRLYRRDIFALHQVDEGDLNKQNRHAAYRVFTLWRHGRLVAGDRRVIPSCCVWRVRDTFPDPLGQYTGFKAGRLG